MILKNIIKRNETHLRVKIAPKKKEFQLISPDETYFTYKMKMNHLMKKKNSYQIVCIHILSYQ